LAECRRANTSGDDQLAADLLLQLDELTTGELAGKLENWMLDWLASRVGKMPQELAGDRPFTALGIDSLTAIELNHEFETTLRVQVPPIVAWDYPTPRELSRFLAEQMKLPVAANVGNAEAAVSSTASNGRTPR
jgi:acyl carrier protein